MQRAELATWRDRWTAAGIPTIPLRPNDKGPMCAAWSVRSSADQWHEVGTGYAGNIGTVPGNGLVVIDCDALSTLTNVRDALIDLGISEPIVVHSATAGHAHVYLKARGDPPSSTSRGNLLADLGPGDLRWSSGSYLVAPCSTVDGRVYRFERGGPESIPLQHAIRWTDLERLLARRAAQPITSGVSGSLTHPPIPLLRRDMPQRARWLLDYLRTALPGQPVSILDLDRKAVKLYASRSEAGTAVVAMLILSGWNLDDVRREFERSQPGHWAEQRDQERCLRRKYQYALEALSSSPPRRVIARLYEHAAGMAWPGRTGLTDRAVYLALLAVAWQWQTWTPYAAQRDLAEYAATKRQTVGRALKRLQAAGMIELAELPDRNASIGTRWDLSRWALAAMESVALGDHKSHVKRVGAAVGGDAAAACEVWATVGRSAGAVWQQLGDEPLGVAALVAATGKHLATVYRALQRLQGWDLAEAVEGGWVRSARALQDVALEVDAAGRARRRHQVHELQRLAWRERVAGLGTCSALEVGQVEQEQVEVIPMGPAWPWGIDT